MDVFSTGTIAVISANLGGIDKPLEHEEQSINCDYFTYDDENFPPRISMTPRLQAKLPKMFAWQMNPGYEFYIWLDSNLRFSSRDSIAYLYSALSYNDVLVLKHPRRDTVYWEYRYNWRGLHSKATSNYLTSRYTGELLDEQYEVIKNDPDYKDDLMVNGGIFMYRNTPEVQAMLKEWWYHVSRYLVMDQLSWPYVLKKSGLPIKVLEDDFANCEWLENRKHG